MIYLDSNVFLNALLNDGKTGQNARRTLLQIQKGELAGGTSTLTFDEVAWVLQKERSKKDYLDALNALIGMPNLIFFEVNLEVISLSLILIEEFTLDPRDAIHAATCKKHKIKEIISKDKGFDKIKFLKRKNF